MDLKALNALKSVKPKRKPKRVGRGTGSGHGKTCGRGHKGAGARSGHRLRDFYEGGNIPSVRKYPKRGFSNARFKRSYAVLNVSDLSCFEDGAEITPETLKETRLIKQPLAGIKILGDGDLEPKNLRITAHKVSKQARAKLEARGCTITELRPATPAKPGRHEMRRREKERAAKAAAGKGKDQGKGKGKRGAKAKKG